MISVLEALEDGRIHQAKFIELDACIGGCVGGALTVENTYIAKSRLVHIMNTITPTRKPGGFPEDQLKEDFPITYEPYMQLDSNVEKAMEKLAKIEEVKSRLNGMDCGACGAPTCRALAEDIVNGEGDFDAIVKQADASFTLDNDGALKRNPKGFPADAPYSEYIRLKYFCLTAIPDDEFWEGEDLAKRIASKFATTKPFLDYINRAITFEREEE